MNAAGGLEESQGAACGGEAAAIFEAQHHFRIQGVLMLQLLQLSENMHQVQGVL